MKIKTLQQLREQGRIGKIKVLSKILEGSDLRIFTLLMSKIIVVRAEFIYSEQAIVYDCYSTEFNSKENGEAIPYYEALVSSTPKDDGDVDYAISFQEIQ